MKQIVVTSVLALSTLFAACASHPILPDTCHIDADNGFVRTALERASSVVVARLERYAVSGNEPTAETGFADFVYSYTAAPLTTLRGRAQRGELSLFMRHREWFDEEIEPSLVAPPTPGRTAVLYLAEPAVADRALGSFVILYADICDPVE